MIKRILRRLITKWKTEEEIPGKIIQLDDYREKKRSDVSIAPMALTDNKIIRYKMGINSFKSEEFVDGSTVLIEDFSSDNGQKKGYYFDAVIPYWLLQ